MSASSERPGTLRRAHAALALLAAWTFFFLPHLTSDGVPYYRDNLLTLLPIKAFVGAELRAGRWPAWYPYESLGMPFIGQVVTGFFHPHTVLSLVLSPSSALKIELLAAYLWGAAGGYRMARASRCSRVSALAAAFSLAFGGYALGMSNALPYLLSVATLPWVAWASMRLAARPSLRGIAILALLCALLFLGGDAQAFLLCPLVVLPGIVQYPHRGRALLYCAAAAPLSALLVSAELLPAMALGPDTLRESGEPSAALLTAFALHPRRLPEIVVAHFVPDQVRSRFVGELLGGDTALWSSSIFLGVVAIALVALAVALRPRQAWPWAALAIGGTLLALGARGGLLGAASKAVPLLARFRYPEKYFALVSVAVAALVAVGLETARERPRAAATAAAIAAVLLGVFAACVATIDVPGLVWTSAGDVLPQADPARGVLRAAWLRGACAGALMATLLALACATGFQVRAKGVLVPFLLFVELWLGNGDQFPLVPKEAIELPSPFAHAVLADGGGTPPPRVVPVANPPVSSTVTLGDGVRWVATMRELLRADVAALSGIAAFGNNLPGTSARDYLLLGFRDERAAVLGRRLGACHRIVDPRAPLRPGDQPMARNPALGLVLLRQPCVPPARITAALPARNREEAAERVFSGLPVDRIVWEGGPALEAPAGEAQVRSWTPTRWRIETRSSARAALVVTQAFVRGWSARVDGAPARIFPADVVLQGIEVPPGSHQVELDYSVPGGRVGIALSIAGVLACLALASRDYLRSRREKMPIASSKNSAA